MDEKRQEEVMHEFIGGEGALGTYETLFVVDDDMMKLLDRKES